MVCTRCSLGQGLPNICAGLLEVFCVCLCSLWGLGKTVLSSLLTFQTRTAAFLHSFLLSLLTLACPWKEKLSVVFFLLHDSSQAQCRIQVYIWCASFLAFCSLCQLRFLFLSSLYRLIEELERASVLKLQIIYRSAGLGAITSHIILKWFVNHGMGTAALEEGAISQNSYLIKVHMENFRTSVAMAYSL